MKTFSQILLLGLLVSLIALPFLARVKKNQVNDFKQADTLKVDGFYVNNTKNSLNINSDSLSKYEEPNQTD